MLKKSILMMLLFQTLVAAAQVKKVKNINYANNNNEKNTLNIYYKNDSVKDKPVLIFIHGGSWSSGKKESYWWLGRNLARKGVVTVLINYPLAPNAQYEKMAADCALAVKWVHTHINEYTASPQKIFVMGHSAGAHLGELINADPQYFKALAIKNPIAGVILDDPFGLDMYQYLSEAEKDHYYQDFIRTFSTKPEVWKAGSPMSYISHINNPHLFFYGEKTYQAIKLQTPKLAEKLKNKGIKVEVKEIKGKSHVPMITQMIFSGNPLYGYILDFIKKSTS